jgi:hypothetical protein
MGSWPLRSQYRHPGHLNECCRTHILADGETGHTQIGITIDLYSHVTATMQRDAVTAFEGLLGSTEGSKPGSEQDEEPESSSQRP